MSVTKSRAATMRVPHKNRREVRTQFGALCWRRRKEKIQVLLVTSRDTGRWIIPKGWPMDDETPASAAATEAFEEAGVEGRTNPNCIGIYSFDKMDVGEHHRLPCIVAVFPIKVKKLRSQYPEKSERRRKWVSRKKARKLVREPELREIIKQFDPPRKSKPKSKAKDAGSLAV